MKGKVMGLQVILTFLNENQGALLSILTLVYVVATLITTAFIHRSNRLVRESNQLTFQFEEERNRPYVIFDFVFEQNIIYAILKNIGKTPAINVLLSLDKKMADLHTDKRMPFPENLISFMAPDRVLRDFINIAHQLFQDKQKHVYTVTIKYQNTKNKDYLETFTVDLDHNKGLTYLVPQDHLKEIANSVKDINKNMNELKKAMDCLVWEQNSLLEKHSMFGLPEDENFNAEEFLKEYFKDKLDHNRKVFFEQIGRAHV